MLEIAICLQKLKLQKLCFFFLKPLLNRMRIKFKLQFFDQGKEKTRLRIDWEKEEAKSAPYFLDKLLSN